MTATPEEATNLLNSLAEQSRDPDERFNGLAASQSVLSRDWDTAEEDAAWADL
jgi:hypothetical protein